MTVADKDHLHHRLMRLGHGQRRSVLILWGWPVLLTLVAAGCFAELFFFAAMAGA